MQATPIMISMLFIGVGIFNILYFIGQFGDLALLVMVRL